MTGVRRLPMFPLGSVLFPHQLVPIHVFEPRYRELTSRCINGDRRFGVVLIERGNEVGGGESRFAAGTVAEILEAARLPDGRWLLEVVGRERLRVERWLPDDPHPWAQVTLLDEAPTAKGAGALRDEVVGRLRRLLALRTELGDPAPPATVDLDPDPVLASWQVCALSGFNPLDGLRLLETDGVADRLAALAGLFDDEIVVTEARLSP